MGEALLYKSKWAKLTPEEGKSPIFSSPPCNVPPPQNPNTLLRRCRGPALAIRRRR